MSDGPQRTVAAVHGRRPIEPDPPFEVALSEHLRATHSLTGLAEIYGRFVHGEGMFDALMRRVTLRAMAGEFGDGVQVHRGVIFRHPETFSVGSGVFIGD